MADVTGTITGPDGVEDVVLNNAATEATLKQLLLSSLAGNKQTLDSINRWATRAGFNDDAIARANASLKGTAQNAGEAANTVSKLDLVTKAVNTSFTNLASVTSTITSGAGSFSDVFNAMSQLPYGIGQVSLAFATILKFQEDNFKSYQSITNAGVSFSGSLTDMRMAAANSYLTLQEFTDLINKNSSTLALMGDTVSDGARSFSTFSKEFVSGDTGRNLLALGYTFEDLNQGALDYIQMTGGRTQSELNNITGITQGTGLYLEELDGLAEITGKNRKEQEAELKKLSLNSAWENYLARLRLTEGQQAVDKAVIGLAEANARGGKVMAENFQSLSLFGTVLDSAHGQFAGALPGATNELTNLVSNVHDTTKTVSDQTKAGASMQYAAAQDFENASLPFQVALLKGGQLQQAANVSARANTIQINKELSTREAWTNLVDQVTANQRTREQSQAADLASLSQSFKNLGSVILDAMIPAVKIVTSIVTHMAAAFSLVITGLSKIPGLLSVLGLAIVGLTGYIAAQKATLLFKETVGDILLARGGKGILGFGTLGTITNPMYVIPVGGAALGGGGGGIIEKSLEKYGPAVTGFFGKYILPYLSKVTTVLAGIGALFQVSDTTERKNKGEINQQTANKEYGKATGGLIGASVLGTLLYGLALGLAPETGGLSLALLAAGGAGVGGFAGGKLGELAGGLIPTEEEKKKDDTTKEVSDQAQMREVMSQQNSTLKAIHSTLQDTKNIHEEGLDYTQDIYDNVGGFTFYSIRKQNP